MDFQSLKRRERVAELGREALVHLELRANLEEKGRGRPGGGLERIRWVSWKHQQAQAGGGGERRGGGGGWKGPGQGARWWLLISRKLTLSSSFLYPWH